MSRPITILIADDHPVFRKGLKEVISERPGLTIVGETGESERVVEMVSSLKPDILLLDLNMSPLSGLEITERLRDRDDPAKIIILTMHREEQVFNRAMDLGVRGYVLKEAAALDILNCILAVHSDHYYLSPGISQYLVDRSARRESLRREYPRLDALTAMELKVLKLVSEKKTSKEIADKLFLSVRTIENHRMNICTKLDLHGSNTLLKFAIEHKSSL